MRLWRLFARFRRWLNVALTAPAPTPAQAIFAEMGSVRAEIDAIRHELLGELSMPRTPREIIEARAVERARATFGDGLITIHADTRALAIDALIALSRTEAA